MSSRVMAAVCLCCLATPLVFASMTDSRAVFEAQKLWGRIAMIAPLRGSGSSNWDRLIGVKAATCHCTTGDIAAGRCLNEFIPLARGFNTWDSAFVAYAAHPPVTAGPFSGTVMLSQHASDDVGVVGAQFFVDDVAIGPSAVDPPKQTLALIVDLDTRLITKGFHVLCFQAWDAAGNYVMEEPRFFTVDQSVPPTITPWDVKRPVNVAYLRRPN